MTNCVQRSIDEKWVPILRGDHASAGVSDCPCCQIHYESHHCLGCPIRNYTGAWYCKRTPVSIYEAWEQLLDYPWGWPYDIHAELTACAQWEIDFLREVERGLRE